MDGHGPPCWQWSCLGGGDARGLGAETTVFFTFSAFPAFSITTFISIKVEKIHTLHLDFRLNLSSSQVAKEANFKLKLPPSI